MNIVELYFSALNAPPLYDLYLDRDGVFIPMFPELQTLQGLTQIVVEGADLTPQQEDAIKIYVATSNAEIHYL